MSALTVSLILKGGKKIYPAVRSMMVSFLIVVLWLLVFPLPATALTHTVDNDGVDCPGAPFTTISAAVTAALPGDIIVVCNGTYVEQVTINKNLTLQAAIGSQGNMVIVKAPATTLTDPKAIILITGMLATNVNIDGLIVEGPGPANCDSLRWGIRVDGGATAHITHNLIRDIRDDPFSGCQNGIGILVGRNAENTTGIATMAENVILDYQKGGIVVDNSGSSAVITNNVIIGVGRTQIIAQNGIQISRGATVPPSNLQANTINANFYLNRSVPTTPAVATGILYFQSGDSGFAGPLNSGNKLRHNQINVSIIP